MPESLKGHCLCGAVTITARTHAASVSACHCSMCRRWSGAAMWVLEAPADSVDVAGPVQSYRSSSFAERAWCSECGTQLWIRDSGADYELMPGLFDDARGIPLTHEIYVDRAFRCVPLAGDHARVTRAAYEAEAAFVEGEL